MLNGEIVTDSEPNDPSTYLQPKSQEFEAVIEKRANAIIRDRFEEREQK